MLHIAIQVTSNGNDWSVALCDPDDPGDALDPPVVASATCTRVSEIHETAAVLVEAHFGIKDAYSMAIYFDERSSRLDHGDQGAELMGSASFADASEELVVTRTTDRDAGRSHAWVHRLPLSDPNAASIQSIPLDEVQARWLLLQLQDAVLEWERRRGLKEIQQSGESWRFLEVMFPRPRIVSPQ